MDFIKYTQNDYVLAFLELLLFLIFIFGLLQDHVIHRQSGILVDRGEISKKIIRNSFAGFLTLFVIPIITLEYTYNDHKLIILLLNTFAIGYLFLFNGWFRTRIVMRIYVAFETFIEKR